MKAYRLYAPSLDQLRLVDEPVPTPGLGEVLVKIHSVSLNYKDLLFVKPLAEGGIACPQPTIPISDMAGEITAIGPDVTEWQIGDRITAAVMPGWFEGVIPANPPALGYGLDGVLCEYGTFRADSILRIPAAYSFEEASTLPIAALSAWNAVEHVRAGESVLILGTGGVALFALQFVKALGARTIITSSSDAKLDRARLLGADETVNYRTHTDWNMQVLELTDGRGVDHVVETVSGTNLTQSVGCTAIGGHVYVVGLQDKGLMDPYQIQYRAVNVHGIRVGSLEQFRQMIAFIDQHDILPVIDRVFPFSETLDAYAHLKAAGHFGKIVINID